VMRNIETVCTKLAPLLASTSKSPAR
jgi:hypothetical protein